MRCTLSGRQSLCVHVQRQPAVRMTHQLLGNETTVRVGRDERAQVRRSELEFEGELDGAGAADLVEGLKPPLAPSDSDCSPGFVHSMPNDGIISPNSLVYSCEFNA